MMHAKSSSHGKERWLLPDSRAASLPATCSGLAGSVRDRDRAVSAFSISSPVIANGDRLPPSRHDAAPRSVNHKRGIRQQTTRSMISFMDRSSSGSPSAADGNQEERRDAQARKAAWVPAGPHSLGPKRTLSSGNRRGFFRA